MPEILEAKPFRACRNVRGISGFARYPEASSGEGFPQKAFARPVDFLDHLALFESVPLVQLLFGQLHGFGWLQKPESCYSILVQVCLRYFEWTNARIYWLAAPKLKKQ